MVAIFALSPQLLFSQSRNVRVLENKKGSAVVLNDQNNGKYYSIKSTYSDSTLFFTTEQSIDHKRVIYCYDLASEKQSTLTIPKTRKYKSFFDERILSFSICGSMYVFVCNNTLFILRRIKGNKLQFVAKIKNEYNFMQSHTIGKNVMVSVCYNFHPEDATYKHVWAIINLTENRLSQVTIQSDENALFGSFVNNWINVSDSKIAYARASEYTITIHDDQFKQLDSIKTTELDGNKRYIQQFKEENLYSKDAIFHLKQLDDSLLTRIRKVYFLNDTTILALIKLAGKKELRADYWLKSNGNWTRLDQDYSSIWYVEGKTYSNDQMIYADFYQNTFGFSYSGDNQFPLVYFPYIPAISTTNFNSDENYFQLQNEAIKNNDTFFGVKKYQIIIPTP